MSSTLSGMLPSPEFEQYLKRVVRFCSTQEWEDRYFALLERANIWCYPRFNIIDFGCGTGRGYEVFKQISDGKYVGVEQGEMLRYARAMNYDAPNYQVQSSLQAVLKQFGPESFDAVVFSNSLAHVEDPIRVLVEAWMLVRRWGHVVVLTNNSRFDRWRWLPNKLKGYQSDPTLKHFFSPSSLKGAMFAAGLGEADMQFLGDDAIPGLTPKSHRYYMMATGFKQCSVAELSS